MPDFISIGSVFIDDIVYPDGRTEMGVLGGGAVHAAAGMAVWGERPGLAACIGMAVPSHIPPMLTRHFETEGLSLIDLPQIRAWQVFEYDGTRRELMRVDMTQPFQDGPPPQSLPQSWRKADGMYAVLDGPNFMKWRNNYQQSQFLWEPNQPYMVREHTAEFKRLVPRANILSPNMNEAREIYGFLTPESLIGEMLACGAENAVLRMGENGSLLATKSAPYPVHVPAIPVKNIVDVTGAGNAYCGAFLVGYIKTGSALMAARWGAVAASFCIEQSGIINLDRPDLQSERERRLKWLEAQ